MKIKTNIRAGATVPPPVSRCVGAGGGGGGGAGGGGGRGGFGEILPV
jgi:hypothetical protein